MRTQDRVILAVQGVGYEVQIGSRLLEVLGPVGSKAELIVYTDVKENAITLYGFQNHSEREMFLMLKRVQGIGSKIALGITSVLTPAELLGAIAREDLRALTNIPGIGKKTAERIIIELRELVRSMAQGNLSNLDGFEPAATPGLKIVRSQTPASSRSDAVMALEKLGFSLDRAERAVNSALSALSAEKHSDAGEVLKEALLHLG